MTHRTIPSPSVGKLNPSFLAQHGMTLIGVRDGRLTVAMRDCDDRDAIAALRFATGLEIAPVPLYEHEPELLRAFEHDAARRGSAPGPSLLDQISERLPFHRDPETVLAPLTMLLKAGYEPAQAGERLLLIEPLDPRLRMLAQRLADRQPLETVIADCGMFPWLMEAMQAWAGRQPAPADLIVAVVRAGPLTVMRKGAVRLTGECLILSLPLLVAARALPAGMAVVLGLLAVLLLSSLRLLLAKRADSDTVRAEVLGLVGKLAAMGLPPALAIRTGLSRLHSLTGGHSAREPSREHLADVLSLPGMPTALLMHGELDKAAAHTAACCLGRAERRMERFSWILRAVVLAAFGVALVLTSA